MIRGESICHNKEGFLTIVGNEVENNRDNIRYGG